MSIEAKRSLQIAVLSFTIAMINQPSKPLPKANKVLDSMLALQGVSLQPSDNQLRVQLGLFFLDARGNKVPL